MCELRELDTVFFADEALFVLSLSDIVYLQRLVARRCHEQLAIVIVVYREHVRRLAGIFDVFTPQKLQQRMFRQSPGNGIVFPCGVYINCERTLVGRNDDMMSLRLDTGAVDREMLSDAPLRSGRSRSIGVDDMVGAGSYNIIGKGPVTGGLTSPSTVKLREDQVFGVGAQRPA